MTVIVAVVEVIQQGGSEGVRPAGRDGGDGKILITCVVEPANCIAGSIRALIVIDAKNVIVLSQEPIHAGIDAICPLSILIDTVPQIPARHTCASGVSPWP